MRFVLDAGHGGEKPGAVFDPDVEVDGDEIRETDINLNVTMGVGHLLRLMGHEVIHTRDRDIHLSLAQRKDMIKQYRPSAFVSIHCNASASHRAKGVEAFYRDAVDKPLAVAIQQALAAMTGMQDRGVFEDIGELKKRLTVLDDSPETPATLVEIGFIDNDEDRAYLIENQRTIAEIIAYAVHGWAVNQIEGGQA